MDASNTTGWSPLMLTGIFAPMIEAFTESMASRRPLRYFSWSSQRFGAYSRSRVRLHTNKTFIRCSDSSQPRSSKWLRARSFNVDITVGPHRLTNTQVTGRVIDRDSGVPLPNVGFSLSILAGGGDRQRAWGWWTARCCRTVMVSPCG